MTNKDNMDDTKMLCKLMTEATEAAMDDVASAIGKVKPGDNHKESIKNLHSTKKEALARTYAFLMNKLEDEEDVIKFTKEGLELMIMNRLKQLMPDVCKKCNKIHFTSREEIPEVACRMCNTGACRECFPVEEGMNKWIYLCTLCDNFVQQQRGEEALEKSHFNQKVKKKVEKKKEDEIAVEPPAKEDTEEVIELGDDVETEEEKEDEDFEEARSKKRGFKKTNIFVKPTLKEKEVEGRKDKKEKKEIVCSHFRKARCFFGMSGKVPHDGVPSCPYKHPTVCHRLLRHGDRGRGGCRGKEDGCKESHPRMCFTSINTRVCPNGKTCNNGYHIKGTIEPSQKVPEKEKVKNRNPKEKEQEAFPRLQSTNPPKGFKDASPFGEILLQQKQLIAQMKQQQDQSMKQQEQCNMLQAILTSMVEQRMTTPLTTAPAPAPLSLADCLRLRMVGSG